MICNLQNILATDMKDHEDAIDSNVDGVGGIEHGGCNILQSLSWLQMGRVNVEQEHIEHDGHQGHDDPKPQGKEKATV